MSRQEKIQKATRWGAVALAAIIVVLLIQPLLPPTVQQEERNAVSVEERHAFVLEANGNPVLYIQNLQGDWIDWPLSATSDSTVCYVDTLPGRWVNRFYGLPSCRGRVLIPNIDTATDSIVQRVNSDIHNIVERQRGIMRKWDNRLTQMTDELNYYLEANNVTDEGYNTVATYATYVVKKRRLVVQALHVLDSLLPTDSLRIHRVHHNTLLLSTTEEPTTSPFRRSQFHSDSTLLRIPCHDDGEQNTGKPYRRIQADNRKTPEGACARYFGKPSEAEASNSSHKAFHQLPPYIYQGEMANGQREGHGIFIDQQGNYYNGQWQNGLRNGFGCAVDSTGKVCVGEWKDDRFLGQRLTYTEERIYGIDISRYQHDIDKKHYAIHWPQVRISHLGTISKKRVSGTVDYPVSFCFIKVSEGITIRNNYFASDYAAARRQGIRVGCYHFFSTKSSASEQAAFFIKNARFSRGDMPPVLDLEPTDAQIRAMGGAEVLFKRVRLWMKAVEKHCGQKPILYVGQNFVNKYLGKAPDIKRDYLVWIARYGEYKPDVRLAFWQLCPDGRVKGITGTVDINVFNGYHDQYQDFLDLYTIK